ncbi:MAG: mercuric reductase [Pirellulaceae bacterium]|nr:MAG: mercuric reductase [Pirellulaceae bacterium]
MDYRIVLQPDDEFNRQLEANVRPPQWVNPTPDGPYNLVVIGAGTAGLVAAAGAAGLGAKVALIERGLMGGDCLNVGCVPSKALLSAARAARQLHRASELGIDLENTSVDPDFERVMQRMRRLRAAISPHDSAARFRDLGVDVFLGQARFTSPRTVEVDGRQLRFSKALIATGARAAAPPIAGLSEVPYLTNETLFSLTELPRRMGVIGAGPVGCEMAQAFANFGADVLLVETAHGVLPKEDRDAAMRVQQALESDGVRLLCCGKQLEVRREDDGIRLKVSSHGEQYDATVDQLLVAVGRAPNVQGLGLESAEVEYDEREGIQVDDRLRTTNRRIFAAGDVCSTYKFTHAADFLARIALQNALFPSRAKASKLTIPWCTYTSPELAQVGLTREQATEQEIEFDCYTQHFREVDRAILEDTTEGFVRVLTRSGTDKLIGATIVGPHAGDMIGELTQAMQYKLGLKQIGSTIHPYPTLGEAIRRLGDQYHRTRLTPWIKRVLAWWLRLHR